MGRLQKRGIKQGSPCWAEIPSPTSFLDPASPADDKTPNSVTELSPRNYSSFFVLWPNKSTPTVLSPGLGTIRLKQGQIDISSYRQSKLRSIQDASDQVPNIVRSPRLPRHVPIIIPDFAHPFAIHQHSPLASNQQTSQPAAHLKGGIGPVAQTDAASTLLQPPQAQRETELVSPSPYIPVEMNSSQTSLALLDQSQESNNVAPPSVVSASAQVGISPVVNPQPAGPTNLSGLVCNIYRTTGEEPHALVGATTTILGDKLYVFGGRIHSRTKPKLTSDLYQLDLIRRRWTKLDANGDIPPPRYFHSVCALGDKKLVCYGGMSPAQHLRPQPSGQPPAPQQAPEPQPEVVVMSDVHVFDVPTRTWTLIASSDNPQGRYAHCAAILPSSGVFTSAIAPLSAIHHNPSSSDPHSGTLGVQIDGTAGAEMVVVGGQDNANNYIEQISVFNLRSLKWTQTTTWDRKYGAYKSMVAPLTGMSVNDIGRGNPPEEEEQPSTEVQEDGTSTLIYSNYNFLDVKLELQIRLPDGNLVERPISGNVSPPGLRFPNGGIIDKHFVVSGTYLTSSKHEYALWALDLRTLTWGRIDTNGSVFSQGSWNRGVLWNRRNTYVILGHRKRSLVDDYNHRRINFSHVCLVELEAFGLYDNPRKCTPTSGYVSVSSPAIPASLQASLPSQSAGGRPYTSAAEQLGQAALGIAEMADMELIAIGGEKIACNSQILSRRWGPYFDQLMMESSTTHENNSISDAATLRNNAHSQASRNSSITITPSLGNASIQSGATTLAAASIDGNLDSLRSASRATTRTLEPPGATSVPAWSRSRSLYLPHMLQTIQLMLHYLYTSSLPAVGGPLCTPHILCSLLQMARPYQIDGLLEATVERLHQVLDGRNAAAVFNAAAMAAGGGRGLGTGGGGTLEMLDRIENNTNAGDGDADEKIVNGKMAGLRIDTNMATNRTKRLGHEKAESPSSASTATSASTSTSFSVTDTEESGTASSGKEQQKKEADKGEAWTGDLSSVIGLQKRGLRGLMEGRRMRERANTIPIVNPD